MAKLPQSLASGEVPGGFTQGTPSARAWAATGVALGDFGEMAERESQKWFVVEQKLQESRNAVFKSRVASRASAFTDDYIAKFGSDKAGKVVSEEYAAAFTRFVEGELQGVENEGLRNAILAHANLIMADGAGAARKTANVKVMEATQNAALLQIKDLESKGTPEAVQEATGLIQGLTDAGVFSAEAGAARRELLRKGAAQNAFARLLAADPEEALRAVNTRQGLFDSLDDEEITRLRGAARSEIEHQQARDRQRRADEEHLQKKREQEVKAEADFAHMEATSQAMNGQYSLSRLEADARLYRWPAEKYQHLRELMTNPKGVPSNPEILQQAMLRARATTVTQRDRDWLAIQYSKRLLTAEDYAKVDNEAQQNLRSLVDESKSNLARSHGQAEQELQAALGITGLLETLTQDQKKAYAAALFELTDRSAFMRGKEDPIAVVREIAPKYQAIITDGAALTIDQKTRLLRYKTPEELEAAFKAKQITPQAYKIEKQRFIEIGAYLSPMQRANILTPSETPRSGGKPGLKRTPEQMRQGSTE